MAVCSTLVQIQSLPILPVQLARAGLHSSPAGNTFATQSFAVLYLGLIRGHVDRPLTHIISSTICVDHRLSSPWPLLIEDIEGNACQIDLEPGELVFYEGARLKHGRPYPLDGDYYAGIFVHYRPLERPPSAPDSR